jgi:hypothetical protein
MVMRRQNVGRFQVMLSPAAGSALIPGIDDNHAIAGADQIGIVVRQAGR